MALVRMRETVCLGNEYYQDITESAPQELKESLQRVQKNRITESTANIESITKLLRESSLNEDIVTKVVDGLIREGIDAVKQRIYKVPVARINPPGTLNGNHRRYPKELWENVMNNQKDRWQGLCGLADHPTDDTDPGSIKNSAIVWLGMDIDPVTNLVYGIGTFVGPYGHMFQEIIDAGGRVGFSSSGFGELMYDKETVNPDTYTIERLADVVLNPSQDVYGAISDETRVGNIEYTKQEPVIKESKETLVESQEPKFNIINEKKEKPMEDLKENTKSSAFAKAEEKALRNHINSFLNENTQVTDPLQKMSDLNEILTIIKEGKLTDLEEGVVNKLTEMQVQLEKDIEDSQKLKEAMGSSDISEITENTQKLMETGTLLADQVADYKTLCEGLKARNEELTKKNKALEFRISLKEKRVEKVNFEKNQESVANSAQVDALKEELKDVKESSLKEIKSLKESVAKYQKGNRELERKNGILETKLNEANKVLQTNAKLKEGKVAVSKAEKEELENLREENKALKGMVERLQKRNADLKFKLEESENEIKAVNDKYEEATTPNIHVKPRYTETVSKYFNWRENEGLEIEDFWNSKLTQYGESILPFERQIRDAKTLREAQKAFFNALPSIDEDAAAAKRATFYEGGADAKERMRILESSGMKQDLDESVESANASFQKKLDELGYI